MPETLSFHGWDPAVVAFDATNGAVRWRQLRGETIQAIAVTVVAAIGRVDGTMAVAWDADAGVVIWDVPRPESAGSGGAGIPRWPRPPTAI